jgi:hypothetical protein
LYGKPDPGASLPARIFLKATAGGRGCAGVRFGDRASAKPSNPGLKTARAKTLSQGYDGGSRRYLQEGRFGLSGVFYQIPGMSRKRTFAQYSR